MRSDSLDERPTDYTDCTDEKATQPEKAADGVGDQKESVSSVKSVGYLGTSDLARRDALKAMAAATGLPILASSLGAQTPQPTSRPAVQFPVVGPRGTPTDPDLLRPKKDWPRKLSPTELATLAVLVDTIIPADAKSPSASAVGVPAWINEYVSAPYDGQMRDLIRVRGGLAWLNVESTRRFNRTFGRLTAAERHQICDDICYLPNAKPEFQSAARFFDLVRDLTAVGFYTTDAGMKDLQYIGNMALPRFTGPPREVLRHLGLEQP
jgi:gluconate 2-dehydrogenase gamma chain